MNCSSAPSHHAARTPLSLSLSLSLALSLSVSHPILYSCPAVHTEKILLAPFLSSTALSLSLSRSLYSSFSQSLLAASLLFCFPFYFLPWRKSLALPPSLSLSFTVIEPNVARPSGSLIFDTGL